MSSHRVPKKCAWAFEDIVLALQEAQRHVGPLVLKPGEHMPTRAFLISNAAHTALCLNRAIQKIQEVHPAALSKAGRSSSNE